MVSGHNFYGKIYSYAVTVKTGGGHRHRALFLMQMNKCDNDSRSTKNLLTQSGPVMQVLTYTTQQVIWICNTRVCATQLTAIEIEML